MTFLTMHFYEIIHELEHDWANYYVWEQCAGGPLSSPQANKPEIHNSQLTACIVSLHALALSEMCQLIATIGGKG